MLKDFDEMVHHVPPVCPITRNKSKEQNQFKSEEFEVWSKKDRYLATFIFN